MIQHVENLRRVYTKEHAELLELRETLMQNERSFGSHTERGIKKYSGLKWRIKDSILNQLPSVIMKLQQYGFFFFFFSR